MQSSSEWKGFYSQARKLESAKPEDAIVLYNKALSIDKEALEVFDALGNLLFKHKRYQAALICRVRATTLRPADVDRLLLLATNLQACDRFSEAVEVYAEASKLRPDDEEIYFNQGKAFMEEARYEEMLVPMNKTIQINPDHKHAVLGSSISYLCTGDFKKGWAAFEVRTKFPEAMIEEPFPEKRWRGQKIKGKLLIGAEQGVGDMIQFIRFLRYARKLCSHLTLIAPGYIAELFSSAAGVNKVVPLKPFPAVNSFEAYIPMLSLPWVLNQNPNAYEVPTPYLDVPKAKKRWATELLRPIDKLYKIGFAWAGNPNYIRDTSRSVPFEFFLDLFAVPNISLVSLQFGDRAADIEKSKVGALIFDVVKHLKTFSETAAIISQLDLVVTCDSAVAHLAGAMGKPVWVLTEFNISWRWILNKNMPVWYPTAKVFQQTPEKNWEEVMFRVTEALKQEVAEKRIAGK